MREDDVFFLIHSLKNVRLISVFSRTTELYLVTVLLHVASNTTITIVEVQKHVNHDLLLILSLFKSCAKAKLDIFNA